MPQFLPPTDNFVRYAESPTRYDRPGILRHIRPTPRGKNIYWLNNDTVVEIQPSDLSTVKYEFLGGHYNYVTDAQAAFLESQGYTILDGVFELDSIYSGELDSDAVLGS